MNNIQKRFLLFLIGCMGTRFFFVYLAKVIDLKYLPYLGYLALLPAIGFAYIYLSKARETGLEVFGGKIWWNDLRPLHATFYGLFAYNAIQKNPKSWMILLVDTLVGLVSFLVHHYLNNGFSSLL
jgi:hypothetical protein